jgi:glutathione S-transferase
MNVALLDLFYADQEWARLRKPSATEFARRRLGGLAASLGDKAYLDGDRFTAGDLMMSTILRIAPELVDDPRLAAYVERCTARPAFQRALQAQLGDFREAA